MNWMNNIFIGLLFAEISGTVLFIIWLILKKIFMKLGAVDSIYYGIRTTCTLFFIPILAAFFIMRDYMRGYMLSYAGIISHSLGKWIEMIMFVWFIGTFVSFGIYIRSIFDFSNIERVRKPCMEEEYHTFLMCKELLGIEKDIQVYRYTTGSIPFAVGLFKPAVYIPDMMLREDELKVIFIHELGHIKYKDLWYRWITMMIRCIYWYNPLVYHLRRECERWGEYHCDHVACMWMESKKEYFSVLMKFAYDEKVNELSVMFRERESEIVRRMEIMKYWKNRKLYMKYIVAVLIVCACMLNAGSVFAAEKVMQNVYNKEYELDKVSIASEDDLGNTLEEFIVVGPFEGTVVEMEDNVMVLGTTKYIDWTMNADTTYLTSRFTANEGDYIAISVVFSSNDVTMRAGIVKPNGEKIAVSSTRGITHTFTADVSGTYQVFVTNPNDETVLVDGSYSIY